MYRILFALLMLNMNLNANSWPYLPNKIVKKLDQLYVSWELFDNYHFVKGTPYFTSLPNLILGDFNNDKKTDYCLLIETKDSLAQITSLLIAFIDEGDKDFQEYELIKFKGQFSPITIISLVKKGNYYRVDEETREDAIAEADGIVKTLFEKPGGEIFFFGEGNFK